MAGINTVTEAKDDLPAMEVMAGWREIKEGNAKGCRQWLICNGINMGRWSMHFGANCLADIYDCKEYLRNMKEQHPELVLEKYTVCPIVTR